MSPSVPDQSVDTKIATASASATSPTDATSPAVAAAPADDQSNVLEAEELQDLDSSFEDNSDGLSDRTSLISGITKYREENGRRYHGYRDGVYLLPNDAKEQDRLDLSHHIFNLISNGKLHRAPINSPTSVLDVGTGTGIWAIDFADLNPSSHVIGLDLSPIQPGWVPPNLEFLVDDVEDEWPETKFDFIHIRMLSGSIKDWQKLLSQAYEHLNPGGWLEVNEFEVAIHPHDEGEDKPPNIKIWQQGLDEASQKIGRRFDVAVNLKKWLNDAGLVDIEEEVTKVPSGPWAKNRRLKEIGLYQLENMLESTTSYGQAHFTRVLGWSVTEYGILSANVRTELKDPKLHLYSNQYSVWGRKNL